MDELGLGIFSISLELPQSWAITGKSIAISSKGSQGVFSSSGYDPLCYSLYYATAFEPEKRRLVSKLTLAFVSLL